ncbi:hypothetical protein VB834_13670 [Limnoraphis robusta Tam1]|uniref:hypothetical protein n=1 Tax=Limnoraphis robusta TaxID=1118279 RepID=UPI002B20D081|nr:hypothetical protein [Limnoraphis robusta]MEA5495740.1 hypothetical protein [Limnoraphis robusta BA-68 BA1]MEA5540079.1 hypothetical protein [Limnoraphis robusta Tam1]
MTEPQSNQRNIHISRGDYRETNVNDHGTYVEGDYYNNSQQKQIFVELAAEINQIMEQHSKTYPFDTKQVATETIKSIKSNPGTVQRLRSAFKKGSVSALEQFLNHPAASFIIGALEDWQENNKL